MKADKTRSRVPRLLQAVLVVVGIYAAFRVIFDVLLAQPIPASLMVMYMFFVIAGVFMVFTFTEERAEELVAPIKVLVDDPANSRRSPSASGPLSSGTQPSAWWSFTITCWRAFGAPRAP